MSLRRRHAPDARDDTLTQSLLGEQRVDRESDSDTPRKRAIIVYPGPFDYESFLATILAWWQQLLGIAGQLPESISAFLTAWLWRASLAGYRLTHLQVERLHSLRDRIAVKFDSSHPAHQDGLRQLWELAFPGVPCTFKTPKWKEMGWQGEDPATDFRGAGLFGLDNLIYMGQRYPEVFTQLKDKTQGTRAQWDYPFAVAGLNLTFMLSDLFELHERPALQGPGRSTQHPQQNRYSPIGPGDGGGNDDDALAPRKPAGRGFVALLDADEGDVAFEELYVATFQLLDRVFLDMGASYMEFNAVMKRVRQRVEAIVSRTDISLEEMCLQIAQP